MTDFSKTTALDRKRIIKSKNQRWNKHRQHFGQLKNNEMKNQQRKRYHLETNYLVTRTS